MEELRQALTVDASIYQDSVTHPRKPLPRMITDPIKLLTRHLQYHPYLSATLLNDFDPDECAAATDAAHRDSTNELIPHLLLSTSSI